jgi:hypothetical protein
MSLCLRGLVSQSRVELFGHGSAAFYRFFCGVPLPLSRRLVSVLALPSRPSRVAVAPVAHIYTTMPPRSTVFSLTLYTIVE